MQNKLIWVSMAVLLASLLGAASATAFASNPPNQDDQPTGPLEVSVYGKALWSAAPNRPLCDLEKIKVYTQSVRRLVRSKTESGEESETTMPLVKETVMIVTRPSDSDRFVEVISCGGEENSEPDSCGIRFSWDGHYFNNAVWNHPKKVHLFDSFTIATDNFSASGGIITILFPAGTIVTEMDYSHPGATVLKYEYPLD